MFQYQKQIDSEMSEMNDTTYKETTENSKVKNGKLVPTSKNTFENKIHPESQTPWRQEENGGNSQDLEKDTCAVLLTKCKREFALSAAANNNGKVLESLLQPNNYMAIENRVIGECLFLAIDNNNEDAAMAIIKSERWMIVIDRRDDCIKEKALLCSIKIKTRHSETIMKNLIDKMPEVADEVFTRCQEHGEAMDYRKRLKSLEKSQKVNLAKEVLKKWKDKVIEGKKTETILKEGDDKKIVNAAKEVLEQFKNCEKVAATVIQRHKDDKKAKKHGKFKDKHPDEHVSLKHRAKLAEDMWEVANKIKGREDAEIELVVAEMIRRCEKESAEVSKKLGSTNKDHHKGGEIVNLPKEDRKQCEDNVIVEVAEALWNLCQKDTQGDKKEEVRTQFEDNGIVNLAGKPESQIKNAIKMAKKALNQSKVNKKTFEIFKDKLLGGAEWVHKQDQSDNCLKKCLEYRAFARVYKENHPLMIMQRQKRFDLLQQPMVLNYLSKKWKFTGRIVFWVRLAIYLLFVSVLTGYTEGTYAPYTHLKSCNQLASEGYRQGKAAYHCRTATWIMAIVNLVIESAEFIFSVRRRNFWGNVLEICTYVLSILFVWNYEDCQIGTGIRQEWQWNMGTAAILLAWINLVINTQDHPDFGVYGVLVVRLTSIFGKFFIVFMMFIIGFALTLRANLQDQEDFTTFWKAVIKTTAMMIGELTFDDIFTKTRVPYNVYNHIIIFIFMIWMSIFIMNLLIGLAIDDISDVMKQANETKVTLEVELILDIEKNLSLSVRTRLNKWGSKCTRPVRCKTLPKCLKFTRTWLVKKTDKQDNPQDIEIKEIKEKLGILEQLMKDQKDALINLEKLIQQRPE